MAPLTKSWVVGTVAVRRFLLPAIFRLAIFHLLSRRPHRNLGFPSPMRCNSFKPPDNRKQGHASHVLEAGFAQCCALGPKNNGTIRPIRAMDNRS